MTKLKIKVGPYEFTGIMEEEKAPKSCKLLKEWLPYKSKIIHARWSGGALYIPLDDVETGLPFENHTVHPSRGDLLFYPGGYTGAEILFPYGSTCFASQQGQLAGNHFITLTSGHEHLEALGKLTLWEGAQDISFEEIQ